ncbi:flavin-containing monooxygenase [Rhodococcus rhodochrous]|uniref:flavin-containing monooxygenase n=1 Tax=Rhodococcus rhodochrous TaxID=1829 RepID=UPI00188CD1AD|nr:NAD(P)/FAD-dependent oxidoreductase [Rhodococcus rhodochrous]MBF4476668.1 NAD(P)/FAD-dependent oxidoreductase [Rhodococcus rhodochrous]
MSTDHIYNAIILGAGFGGLGQAAQFRRDGIDDFIILEKASDIGGVWRDNTYPGAACDTQTPIYCYSYFLHLSATKMFAGQDELWAYLHDLVDAFELSDKLRLGREVVAAQWDEADGIWTLDTSQGQRFRCRVFVPAWGQLSTPSIPTLPGIDNFTGVWFHSARWRHDVDLTGARVASVGNAATAVQYVPELARTVSALAIFQRSANYILPRNQHEFTADERKLFLTDPDSYRKVRSDIHKLREDGFARTRLGTTQAQEGAQQALAHLTAQVPDPELRAKLIPDYDFGCKRILRSDDYYPTLTRDNVELITDRIESITPAGIRTADGREREFDVIVFATGFKSQAFQGDLRIVGRDGVTLDERWGNTPEAYLGMSVDGFPNMFLVYGPNTNLNHNSVVTMLEAQHRYIASCVHYLRADPARRLEVDPEVLRSFNTRVQEELEQSAFSASCTSWYKNADGKIINNWCGTVEEYHAETEKLLLADYGIRV